MSNNYRKKKYKYLFILVFLIIFKQFVFADIITRRGDRYYEYGEYSYLLVDNMLSDEQALEIYEKKIAINIKDLLKIYRQGKYFNRFIIRLIKNNVENIFYLIDKRLKIKNQNKIVNFDLNIMKQLGESKLNSINSLAKKYSTESRNFNFNNKIPYKNNPFLLMNKDRITSDLRIYLKSTDSDERSYVYKFPSYINAKNMNLRDFGERKSTLYRKLIIKINTISADYLTIVTSSPLSQYHFTKKDLLFTESSTLNKQIEINKSIKLLRCGYKVNAGDYFLACYLVLPPSEVEIQWVEIKKIIGMKLEDLIIEAEKMSIEENIKNLNYFFDYFHDKLNTKNNYNEKINNFYSKVIENAVRHFNIKFAYIFAKVLTPKISDINKRTEINDAFKKLGYTIIEKEKENKFDFLFEE